MIRFENVSKRFAETVAVAPLSRTISERTTTVLIGPSGCGKSTLLRLVVGLEIPDDGQIIIGDQTLGPSTVTALRHRMGYVIQEGGLFPHITCAENASLLVRHLGWPEADIRDRLEELAELVRLPAHRLQDFPHQLSGGQRQRVSLIRSLMHRPEVLLLDEPLGALDPMIRADLQDDLRDVFSRLDKTVLLVTHDLAEAAFFADEILLMRSGQLVQSGTIGEFNRSPAESFVTEFVNAQRTTHLAD